MAVFQGVFVGNNISDIFQIDDTGALVHTYTITGTSQWMAVDPASLFCFIAPDVGNRLYYIDTTALTINSITLDVGIQFNLFCFATETTVYVVSENQSISTDTYVSIIDIASLTLISTIHIPNRLLTFGACLTPDNKYLYFGGTDRVGTGTHGYYAYVDTATNTLHGPNVLASGTDPTVMTATDTHVYIEDSSATPPGVWTVPVNTGSGGTVIPVATVPGSGLPYITSDQSHVLVPEQLVGDIVVINAATQTVAHTDVFVNPYTCAFPNPYTDSFVMDGGGGTIHRYDKTGTWVSDIANADLAFAFRQNPQLAVSPDGNNLYVILDNNSSVGQFDTTSGALNWDNVPGGSLVTLISTPSAVAPPTVQTAGTLFIPRKGFNASTDYTPDDLYADWLAIELWANNTFIPPVTDLFIPCKPSNRLPTVSELDSNWLHIQDWSMATVVPAFAAASIKVSPLFIPRKSSLDTISLTTSFLAVQDWANAL